MSDREQRPVFELRIQSLPDPDGTETSRLKRLLKSMQRSYGFRCLSIAQINKEPPDSGTLPSPSKSPEPFGDAR